MADVTVDAAAPDVDASYVTDLTDAGLDEPFDVAGGYQTPICASACASLKANGCSEGSARPGEDSCYVLCRRAEATGGRIDLKPRCVAAARGKAAVRACGTYRCI